MMKSIFVVFLVMSLTSGCVIHPRGSDVLPPEALRNLREIWRITIAARDGHESQVPLSTAPAQRRLPATGIAGEALFIEDGNLCAVRLRDGVDLWRSECLLKGTVQIGETVDDLVLYGMGARDGELVVVDRMTGRDRQRRRGLPDGALVVDGGRAYLVNEAHLSAYDLSTLRTVWSIDYPTGQRVLTLRVSGRSIVMEMFHEGYGYPRVFGIDYLGGGVRWDALGTIGAVGDGTAYLMKYRYGEVWARNAHDGSLVSTIRLDRCDGRFLDVVDGDLIYTSEQRYHDPVDIVVDEGRATPVVRRKNIVRELIRSSPSTGKTLWNVPIPVHRDDPKEWLLLPLRDVIAAAVVDPSCGYTHVVAIDRNSGTMAWSILDTSGIASFDASGNHVITTHRDGSLVCYRIVGQ